jgi:nucleotide-binding universal stress UspA family protein
VQTGVVEADEPAEAIAATVREALVELIAMSTRGAGGLRRFVLGSVAEGVVRASEVPVMLLTPTDLGQ